MPIASMTGFARIDVVDGERHWVWELRSVNGRGLDVRCRLPAGYEALDAPARAAAAERCRRGNVNLTLSEAHGLRPRFAINRDALHQILALLGEIGDVAAAPPRLDGLLGLPGVLERVNDADEPAQHLALLEAKLAEALDCLQAMRLQEGHKLEDMALAQLDEIEALVGLARGAAAAQPAAIVERLRLQLEALLAQQPLPGSERLAQEAALLAAKADVREELDRLAAHVGASRTLIRAGGAVGRKLDFLCQELNREANTLCSKSSEIALTRLGLDLKAAIEQLREQIQNIE
jgi:uncharacterized protein (TIGR00255 family)